MKLLKSIFYSALIVGILFMGNSVLAHGDEQALDAEEMVQKIYQEQGVSNRSQLDCAVIDDHTLEELGDAVMSLRHPDTAIHSSMDEMMGGEGSSSLRNAHINMGKGYLGCFDEDYVNMMGTSMMNNSMMGDIATTKNTASNADSWWNNMHNYEGNAGMFMLIFHISLWILVILGIIWVIRSFLQTPKK